MFKDIIFYFKKCGTISAMFNMGMYSLILYRLGKYLYLSRLRKLNPIWYFYLIASSVLRAITHIEIPCTANIGQRLFFVHSYGVVLGEVSIGDDCTIAPWVIIGHLNHNGNPIIGNKVYIGPKASVLGKIEIGDNCVIGANALVIKNMPKNSKALGMISSIKQI